MLYSGADLIRTSGQQQERLDRLKVKEKVAPVSPPQRESSNLDDETQGALLRFARFINKEGEGKKKKPAPKASLFGKPGANTHPYKRFDAHVQKLADLGQMLDVYV